MAAIARPLVAPSPDVLVYLIHQVTLGVHVRDERDAHEASQLRLDCLAGVGGFELHMSFFKNPPSASLFFATASSSGVTVRSLRFDIAAFVVFHRNVLPVALNQ